MRPLIFIVALLSASQSWAANPIIRDGRTIQLADVTYRLEGIDAPEFDQICIDEHADTWACGVAARDQLTSLIGSQQVHCEDLGADTSYRKRHIGICTVEGEPVSLNQILVRQGYALNSEPSAKGRFKDDEAGAKDNRLGLWRGCFVAPQESGMDERTAPCWADRAERTRIARYATCYSPIIPPCHPAAASRPSLPYARASPAMSASIRCRGAATILRWPNRIAGFVPRKMLKPPGFGGPIIAGRTPGDRSNDIR